MKIFTIKEYKRLMKNGCRPTLCFRNGEALKVKIHNGNMRILNPHYGNDSCLIPYNNPLYDTAVITMRNGVDDGMLMMRYKKNDTKLKSYKKEQMTIKEKIDAGLIVALPSSGVDKIGEFAEISARLTEQYEQKNTAYGDSFGKSVQKYGLISALTRMSDKWNRLENLILNPDTSKGDESLIDTLNDLASYCIMTRIEIENNKKSNASKI